MERSSSFVNSTSVIANLKDDKKKRNKSVNNDITPISTMFPDIVHSRSVTSNSLEDIERNYPCIYIHTVLFAIICFLLPHCTQFHYESTFASIIFLSYHIISLQKRDDTEAALDGDKQKVKRFRRGVCVRHRDCSALIFWWFSTSIYVMPLPRPYECILTVFCDYLVVRELRTRFNQFYPTSPPTHSPTCLFSFGAQILICLQHTQ